MHDSVKMKKEQLSGCIELEVPYVTLQTCEKLSPGQVIYVSGTAKKKGWSAEENIQVQMKKEQNETISLALYAESLGCILQDQLTDWWHCVLESIISVDRAQLKSGTQDREEVCLSESGLRRQKKATVTPSNTPTPRGSNCTGVTCADSESEQDNEDGGDGHRVEDVKQESGGWCSNGEDVSEPGEQMSPGASSHNARDCIRTSSDQATDSNGIKSNEGSSSDDDSWSGVAQVPKEKLKLACKFCLKPFQKGKNPLMNLQKHIMKRCPVLHQQQAKEQDGSDQSFVCCYCTKSLSTKYNRDRHVETCKMNPNNKADLSQCNIELFYCEDCNWPTRTELDLHKHRVQNHGAPKRPRKKTTVSKPVACRFCGELFKFTSSRCNHERFKCPKNLNVTKSFFCRYCGTRCQSQEALNAHTESKHKDKKCVCKLCGAEFKNRNSKWHHMITVHMENPRRFACPHCDNTYINKRMLLQHMTKHFDERKVQCTICGKCFKNQAQEKSHRRHVHEGLYRFRCSKCGHGVAKRQYLQSHKCGRVRRVQDGEKPIEEPRQEPAEQPQQSQPELLQSRSVQMDNVSVLTREYDAKISNSEVMNQPNSAGQYYNSQTTCVLHSFPQTAADSQGISQIVNGIVQPVPLNTYMSNHEFMPYPNSNC